jgi:hypothetical protein
VPEVIHFFTKEKTLKYGIQDQNHHQHRIGMKTMVFSVAGSFFW